MRPYEEAAYADNRLKGTIVRYKGEAVYINSINADNVVSFTKLVSNQLGSCKTKELDINPVPLGYVNWSKKAWYVCRRPMRQDWKQGLRDNNICLYDGTKVSAIDLSIIARTIDGLFPKFGEVKSQIANQNVQEMAFCRDFSMDVEKKIHFKGKFTVGEFTGRRIRLYDDYDWLNELLEEEVLSVA